MTRTYKLIALAGLLATAVAAQRPFGVMTATAPDPAAMVKNQVDRLTALLSLSTAQATQATTIFTASLNSVAPLQTALNTDWQSMRTAVKANQTGKIGLLATDIGTLTGQIAAIQNNADAAFYAILTADQQTKLDQIGGIGGRGRGGRGGPGGMGPGRGMGAQGRMGRPPM
jgi:Spy/CpxP family protein refolding chaperone